MIELYISMYSLGDLTSGIQVIAYPIQTQSNIRVYINPKQYSIIQQGNTYSIRKLKWYERIKGIFNLGRYHKTN